MDEAQREVYEEAYAEMYADCQKSLFTGGYRLYTSIDLEVQQELQTAIDSGLSDFMDTPQFMIHSLADGYAECLQFLVIIDKDIMNTALCKSLRGHQLSFLRHTYLPPRGNTAG